MRLYIGQPMTAEHIENLGCAWPAQRAVQFYNALLADCLDIGTRGKVLAASFSERIHVGDKGIDAEAQVADLRPDDVRDATLGLVGPGWTVYQFKHRDVRRSTRPKLVHELGREVDQAVAKINQAKARTPARYVLVTNLQLMAGDVSRLKEAILKGSPCSDVVAVVADACFIASLINNRPHLKAVFFDQEAFCTWDVAYGQHMATWPHECPEAFVGRDEEKKKLLAALNAPSCPSVVVTGPPEIGKTRLILEATTNIAHRIAWCQAAPDITKADLQRLEPPRGKTIVVVEHPDTDRLEGLLRTAATLDRVQLVAEMAMARVALPDESVVQVELGPLAPEAVSRLTEQVGFGLDFHGRSWAETLAEGIPGWLVRAAQLGAEFRDRADVTRDDLTRCQWERLTRQLTPRQQRSLQALAVLPQVGFAHGREPELEAVARALDVDPSDVRADIDSLARTGHLVCKHTYAEVFPRALAVMLAERALAGSSTRLYGLYLQLPPTAHLRFFRRLAELRGEQAGQMRMELFADPSRFGSLEGLTRGHQLLHELAPVCPEETADCLCRVLEPMPVEQRRGVVGQVRRYIVWTLEELAQHESTFDRAARMLAWLAEAENESFGNNATNVFIELFHIWHPYLSATHRSRLDLLRRLANDGSQQMRILIAKAAGAALEAHKVYSLCGHDRLSPGETGPRSMTTDAIREYVAGLARIEEDLIRGDDDKVMAAAAVGLAELSTDAVHRGGVEFVLSPLESHGGELHRRLGLRDLAKVLRQLRWLRRTLREHPQEHTPEETARCAQNMLPRVDNCIAVLEGRTFADRLHLWTSSLTEDLIEETTYEGLQERISGELRKLALEVLGCPDELDRTQLDWLMSEDAVRASLFFEELGAVDSGTVWVPAVGDLACRPGGERLFAGYVGGWYRRSAKDAEDYLDEQANRDGVDPQAIIHATLWISPSARSVELVTQVLTRTGVRGGQMLGYPGIAAWAEQLPDDALAQLVETCFQGSADGPLCARFLNWRVRFSGGLPSRLEESAWRVVESYLPSPSQQQQNFNWDRLAAHLSRHDPERGLALLRRAVEQASASENDRTWAPVEHPYEGGLWRTLCAHSRPKALAAVLEGAVHAGKRRRLVTWKVGEIVDLTKDEDTLDEFILSHPGPAEAALVVAECLDAARSGFWAYAAKLVAKFPSDDNLLSTLTMQASSSGPAWGSLGAALEQRAEEALRLARQPDLDPAPRRWARRVADHLKRAAGLHLVWEYDRDIEDLRAAIEDKSSPDRLWAIERVLREAPNLDVVRRLLTVEDIVENLPKVELPPEKRKAYEALLAMWTSNER